MRMKKTQNVLRIRNENFENFLSSPNEKREKRRNEEKLNQLNLFGLMIPSSSYFLRTETMLKLSWRKFQQTLKIREHSIRLFMHKYTQKHIFQGKPAGYAIENLQCCVCWIIDA